MSMPERDDTAQVEYRPVPGFPGYRVGSDGTVWSSLVSHGYGGTEVTDKFTKKLAVNKHRNGYGLVGLNASGVRRTFSIHRLVLTVFVGECPLGMEACHNDGNPMNNSLSNLRWDTKKLNAADRERHGNTATGAKNGQAKLTESDVREIRLLVGTMPRTKIARRYGISVSSVKLIENRINWKYLA
jgi:hypothetical protein